MQEITHLYASGPSLGLEDSDIGWNASCHLEKKGYPPIYLDFDYVSGFNMKASRRREKSTGKEMSNEHSYDVESSPNNSIYGWPLLSSARIATQYSPLGPNVYSEILLKLSQVSMHSNLHECVDNDDPKRFLHPITGTIRWATLSFCAQTYHNPSIENNILRYDGMSESRLQAKEKETMDEMVALTSNSSTDVFYVKYNVWFDFFVQSNMEMFTDTLNHDGADNISVWPALLEAIPTVSGALIRSHGTPGSTNATGYAWEEETYVKVQWEWFALQCSSVLLSAAFLGIVMLKSIGVPFLFKTSLLATLFHGMEGFDDEEIDVGRVKQNQETHSDLLITAKTRRGRLELNEQGHLKILKAE
jgi:hypothetical protein